jgi:hypothetical protein
MAIYRHSYVFRLAVDPVLYLWTGFAPLDTPGDAIDPDGARWIGGSQILDIPALKLLLGGAADRVDFVVSGVDAQTLRLVQDDRAEVQDASVMIGRVSFDGDLQIEAPIAWEWRGVADVLTVESKYAEEGRARRITLSVRSGDTRRNNPLPAFFTDADQKRRSADDDIFDHVAQITTGVTRRFGPK